MNLWQPKPWHFCFGRRVHWVWGASSSFFCGFLAAALCTSRHCTSNTEPWQSGSQSASVMLPTCTLLLLQSILGHWVFHSSHWSKYQQILQIPKWYICAPDGTSDLSVTFTESVKWVWVHVFCCFLWAFLYYSDWPSRGHLGRLALMYISQALMPDYWFQCFFGDAVCDTRTETLIWTVQVYPAERAARTSETMQSTISKGMQRADSFPLEWNYQMTSYDSSVELHSWKLILNRTSHILYQSCTRVSKSCRSKPQWEDPTLEYLAISEIDSQEMTGAKMCQIVISSALIVFPLVMMKSFSALPSNPDPQAFAKRTTQINIHGTNFLTLQNWSIYLYFSIMCSCAFQCSQSAWIWEESSKISQVIANQYILPGHICFSET